MILMFIYMILVCIIVYTLYLLRAAQTELRLLLKEKQKRINELHRHPVTEQRDHIPEDKVIVDSEFKDRFSSYIRYYGNHILVSKAEYHKLTGIK